MRSGPIVAPIDFSANSGPSAGWALHAAHRFGVELVLLHVAHDPCRRQPVGISFDEIARLFQPAGDLHFLDRLTEFGDFDFKHFDCSGLMTMDWPVSE